MLGAPGIARAKRRGLLDLWKSQHRLCAYCGIALATTVDHVVPLARGGTHYEGNLAPACRSCNAAKCDLLLVEWRHGCGPGSSVARDWRPSVPRPRRMGAVRGVQQLLSVCYVCGSFYPGEHRTCGDPRCQREHVGRITRDRYRAAHGIPVDPSQPTAYWRRLTERVA